MAGAALDRAPVPAWAVLGIGALAVTLVEVVLAEAAGPGSSAFTVYFSVAGIYAFGLVHYLQRAAGVAFDRFGAALEAADPTTLGTLRGTLVTMSAVPAAAASGAGILLGALVLVAAGPVADQLRSSGMSDSGAALLVHLPLYALNWAATGVLAYRIVHQSRVVDRLYRQARVDLFQPAPLHAFAWLSAVSVLGLAALFYAPILLVPDVGGAPLWIVRIGLGAALLALFVWPLWGVHRVLASERGRLLARNGARRRLYFDDFHARLEAGERGASDVARGELDLLEREQRTLAAMSTWPWPSGLVPALLGAIVIPLVLSLLVTLAQQLVGG